jgi:CelD/BcsL family acetyltransferase involved in cellulose biosynthesis
MWSGPDGVVRAVAAVASGREPLHRRAPLTVAVTRLAGAGPGAADHVAPLVDPTTPHVAPLVARWCATASGRRSFLGTATDRGQLLERVECPRLDLTTRSGRIGRSANFRAQLGRFERRLEAAGVTCAWQAPETIDARTVDALFDLHLANRDARGRVSSLDDDLRALLHGCAARGGVAGVVATKGEEIVAVLLGFEWCGWYGAYQSGWDPAYAHFSIGSVLVANAIRGAAQHGAHTFDFLRGGEAYKYRFGAEAVFDEVRVVPRGLGGRALVARAALKRRRERRSSP